MEHLIVFKLYANREEKARINAVLGGMSEEQQGEVVKRWLIQKITDMSSVPISVERTLINLKAEAVRAADHIGEKMDIPEVLELYSAIGEAVFQGLGRRLWD
jgi:hypothetical protein